MALIGAFMGPVSAKDGQAGRSPDLAINDFHGHINTLSGSFGGTGGAQNLATNIAAAEEGCETR